MTKAKATSALAAAAISLSTLGAFVPAAGAQSGPSNNCAEYAPVFIAATPSSVQAGQTLSISGALLAGDQVTIRLVAGATTVTLGTVTADASGRFELEVIVPADFPGGQATLQATSPNCPAPISSTVTVLGGTTTTIPGPATCEAGGLVVSFPTTKLIDFDGFNPKVEYTPIVPVSLASGTWNITEAISWDSYPQRINSLQTSEVWVIEFLSGGSVVATSAPTQDLEDNVVTAEWRGPLGAVTLPTAVDGIRARHMPDLFEDAPWGEANSVFPISATVCTDPVTSTTVPGTPTTVDAGTGTTTTLAPGESTSAPTTAPGTGNGQVGGNSTDSGAEVLGNSVTRLDNGAASPSSAVKAAGLAWTGGTVGIIARIATALIAFGSLLALRFRRSAVAS